jgi:hypothetical protein
LSCFPITLARNRSTQRARQTRSCS